ncbi:hypothetical protein GF371_05340 [Candidatus Woesearchaeota archaeon]|nr:hypothetical protein [Candidatus Woesearchaeota archaeon]
MYIELLLVIGGLIGLVVASSFTVKAAQAIARSLAISELIIGLTITSIGTSIPEITTNIFAAVDKLKGLEHASGIAVGNILGSNLSQITIILGICGLIATRLYISKRSLFRDGLMMFVAACILFLASIDGNISRIEGGILITIYLAYLFFISQQEKVVKKEKPSVSKLRIFLYLLMLTVSIAGVLFFGNIMVKHGIFLAKSIQINTYIIGLFVGLGTSLPELSISIAAVIKKSGSLSIGNLIGSNITDPLLSIGIGASIGGFVVAKSVLQFDFIFWIAATAIALLLLFNHQNLNRKEASILILLYAVFIYIKLFLY